MVSKFLEKRIEISPEEITESSGNTLVLEYYLVESKIGKEEYDGYEKDYGVEIIEKKNDNVVESSIFKSIYNKRESIDHLLKLLIENTVTPVTLAYILDDAVGV